MLDKRHRAAHNLVDVLERESEGLVGRSDRGLNGVDGLQKGLTLGGTGLGLLGPTLVPGHVGRVLQHVVSVPSGDGDEGNRLGVVTDLLDESGSLLDDFLVSVLGPLCARDKTKMLETGTLVDEMTRVPTLQVSILLMATMSCLTPKVKAKRACSRV